MNKLEEINVRLHTLVIFHNLLKNPIVQCLSKLLACTANTPVEQVADYAAFVAALFQENDNLTHYLLNCVLEDENIFMLKRAQNLPVEGEIEECLLNELKLLEKISGLTAEEVKVCLAYDGYLPGWKNAEIDFTSVYLNRIKNISSYGYGIFKKYHMFILKNSVIVPVKFPDKIKLFKLIGYQKERKAVINNTLALLKGKPAANVLLYGDAGTGKSATIKAIVNEYQDQGLRLIEIAKKQLGDLPALIDRLSQNPLKFILFIDDLSFANNDDDFGALKAILEGSVSAKTPNIVIYATSNRRHLLKECFSEREGDDIHYNDTVQELISLSERFGLVVNFARPDKKKYLDIVHALAEQYEIMMSREVLELEAERFALGRSGRSPRVARQFMEHLKTLAEDN